MIDDSEIMGAEYNDDVLEASRLYEQLIASGEASLEAYLNLSVLYYVASDGGYAAAYKPDTDFLETAWVRMHELLDEAEVKFGSEPEILFWRHFYRFIWGDLSSLDARYCEELLNCGSSPLPALGLFASFAGLPDQGAAQYRPIAEDLYERVSAGLTTRDRYTRSVLAAALRERS